MCWVVVTKDYTLNLSFIVYNVVILVIKLPLVLKTGYDTRDKITINAKMSKTIMIHAYNINYINAIVIKTKLDGFR